MIGQAISLNGLNQAATVPNMGTYSNATVSVWVNTRDANSPSSQAIFHNRFYTNGTPHFLLAYSGSSPATSMTGVVIDVLTAEIKRNGVNSPISESTSYNLTYRYNRTVPSLRLFINGARSGTGDCDARDLRYSRPRRTGLATREAVTPGKRGISRPVTKAGIRKPAIHPRC